MKKEWEELRLRMDNYKDIIVNKPWGYEYLVYENDQVGLWLLHINEGESTSMHCHPKKSTGLVVLDGEVEVSFLADKRKLKPLDKVMIRRGLFHQTKSISPFGSIIFEIETPKDKHDLVRLSDKYSRTKQAYEGKSFEEPKNKNCLWISNPKPNSKLAYSVCNTHLLVENINSIDIINNKKDTDLIMFLKGGLVRNIDGKNVLVTIPGDVGYGNIIKQVAKELDGVEENTIIMTITKI